MRSCCPKIFFVTVVRWSCGKFHRLLTDLSLDSIPATTANNKKIVNNRRMVVAFAFAARLDLQSVYHHLWTIKLTVVVELYFAAGEFG